MTKETAIYLGQNALYLAACALHGVNPEEALVETMNLEQLYAFCRFHSIAAMICMALEPTAAFAAAEPALQRKWQEEKNKAVRKTLLLDAERAKILAWMESAGIWYLPLKGILLKEFYPRIGMRQMSDNDILYDETFRQQVDDYMTAQGYVGEGGTSHHDAYQKPPVYHFELHTVLFGKRHNPVWQEYYRNVKERLLPDTEGAFAHHFRDEDFYIYVQTHACRHYNTAGIGLRAITDTYVYLRQKGAALDWSYIGAESEKLGITSFERSCRTLAQTFLSQPVYLDASTLSETEQMALATFADSGTYGTAQNRMEKNLKRLAAKGKPITKKEKLRYVCMRLFPDMTWFRLNVPFCCRHKWAIPFYYVYRWFRAIFRSGSRIRQELQAVRSAGHKDIDL